MMRRRSSSSSFGAGAAAVGMALCVLLLQGQPLPGAQAFLLPSRGGIGGGCVGSQERTVTTARTAVTTTTTTRLYHSPGPSMAPATKAAGPQTDEAVPEGHKGLHSYLYGEGGAEGAHSGGSSSSGSGYVKFTRGTVHEVEDWLAQYDSRPGQPKVAGVYGVYDDFGGLRFVGVSRDVGLALRAHQHVQGRKAVARVAVQSFRFPKREEMGNYQAMWLAELAAAPEGNREDGDGGWGGSIKDAVEAGAADAARRAAYEEGKVKLRAAMADPTLQDELDDMDESDDSDDPEEAAAKREALRRAAGGDWSSAIDAQTKATVTPTAAVDSPFDKGQQGGAAGGAPAGAGGAALELTPANVDKVLDEVRPYLISDGGNIEVVRVETEGRNIFLRLQGACGSCPSSTVTMKMGVERVLREKFADLGLVEAVAPEAEQPLAGADGRPLSEQDLLRQKIEQKLGEILPAIRGLGASAAVEGVGADGVVTLRMQGPEKVRLGVVYALKSLPGVTDVRQV